MKTFKRTLGLLILSTLAFGNSMAQTARYTTNGGITIGFGAGMAYQKSDLANSKGYGFDFILGSQLYKKENAFLSVDWKFRFLAGENKAYDHRINPDNTYSNIRYSFFNYDLELGLTLNRLRERTGIVLTGFAGAGITHGRTFTDLYDAENSLYDFSIIDPNLDSKTIYNDLRTLSDGDFETHLVNKAAILPTAGFFIGYQLSSSFTLGVEFKTNFYLSEHNSFAGINLDNRDIAGSSLDRNSYVSMGIRWKLRGGSASNSAASNSSQPISNITEISNEPVQLSLPNPSVTITDPNADSVQTASSTHTLWAIVDHVSGPENISLYQNGFPNHGFTYNASTKVLIANLNLRDGENSIRIQATNQTAAAEDLVIIMLDPAAIIEEAGSKPDITPVQNVGYTPKTYKPGSGSLNTGAVQTNVDYSQYYTGYYQSGISQDQATIEVIEIPAENEADSGPERTSINHDRPVVRKSPVIKESRPCAPPTVSLALNRVNRSDATHEIRGSVSGVKSKAAISLTLDGRPYRAFEFVPARGDLSARFKLTPGSHTIVVSVNNACGTDSESVSVSGEEEVCGPRINPGNAAWQFCLETPSGTFSRENLSNPNFTYSGPATSLYFMPVGGGGDVMVKGRPYTIRAGQYYLFTGNLNVTVSTKNPGSMGHWSVCIRSDREPVSGNGSKRPKSPCEVEKVGGSRGKGRIR